MRTKERQGSSKVFTSINKTSFFLVKIRSISAIVVRARWHSKTQPRMVKSRMTASSQRYPVI